jgi:hypothetical protein
MALPWSGMASSQLACSSTYVLSHYCTRAASRPGTAMGRARRKRLLSRAKTLKSAHHYSILEEHLSIHVGTSVRRALFDCVIALPRRPRRSRAQQSGRAQCPLSGYRSQNQRRHSQPQGITDSYGPGLAFRYMDRSASQSFPPVSCPADLPIFFGSTLNNIGKSGK